MYMYDQEMSLSQTYTWHHEEEISEQRHKRKIYKRYHKRKIAILKNTSTWVISFYISPEFRMDFEADFLWKALRLTFYGKHLSMESQPQIPELDTVDFRLLINFQFTKNK